MVDVAALADQPSVAEGAERIWMMRFDELWIDDDAIADRSCDDCGVTVLTYPPEDGLDPIVLCGRCNHSGLASVIRREAAPSDTVHTALYRFFGLNDVLLYVGISHRLEARLSQHKRAKPWNEIVRIEVFPTRRAAATAERRAIRSEYPVWNIRHARH